MLLQSFETEVGIPTPHLQGKPKLTRGSGAADKPGCEDLVLLASLAVRSLALSGSSVVSAGLCSPRLPVSESQLCSLLAPALE